MFESLGSRLSEIFEGLTRRGALSEAEVDSAMREVRRALLEADVALDVVRSFTAKVRSRAVGAEVLKSVTPGQMTIKIVHDVLVETLGAEAQSIDLDAPPPVAIMMVGLQGAGKTTTTAKIAKRLGENNKKKILMASLDVKRPAAQEQLAVLGRQINTDVLPVIAGQTPVQIAHRAMDSARLQGYDVILLDTAGRTHIDDSLMQEMVDVKTTTKPHEILLVADSLTGQDAVVLAKNFDDRVGLTGIVLTRCDGDGRGGAALSMRAVTGKPVKLIGTGEKIEDIEDFFPDRIANRILGMGDIVSLVEKAAKTIDAEKAQKIADKMRKGRFDLEDLAEQLAQVEKIGGVGGILGMLPGVSKIKSQLASTQMDSKAIGRQRAIILSMTPQERKSPEILKASRKKRIAAGSGMRVEEVNRLLKQHRQMADMMKAMGGASARSPLGKMASMFGMSGGAPAMSPEKMEELQKQFDPRGNDKMAGKTPFGRLPPNLAELSAPKLPGLGANNVFNPFMKKK